MKKTFINMEKIYGTHSSEVRRLEGKGMSTMPVIANGYITVEDGKIAEIGKMNDAVLSYPNLEDMTGQSVFPSYADSHTHIVFAEPREGEFEMKIKGASYEEIAAAGGGILNSASKLQKTDEETLYISALHRAQQMIRMGSGAIEIKSGYGLTMDSELKMLRVANRLKETLDIPVKITFLGAHAFPSQYKSNHEGYLREVLFPAMDVIASEGLAEYVDIFVEKNYFSIELSKKIIDYADKKGLIPKLHVNQLSNMGGVQFGVDRNALSVDHLEEVGEEEIAYLKNKKTIATLLPSCSFFIKIPYAPARQMIDSGLGIALATDYNPGSTPSGNMNFVFSLACIYQGLLPAEAFNALTINGAYAMGLSEQCGSITVGKYANFFTSREARSLASIPYSFGRNIIEDVYVKGEKFI